MVRLNSNLVEISKIQINSWNFHLLTYSGTITHWNDPVLVNSQDIVEWREYLQGTNQRISIWIREDSSGVTQVLSSTLGKMDQNWADAYGSFNTWPDFFSVGNYSYYFRAEGSAGVLAGVGMTPFSIGYSGLTSALANAFSNLARVENRAGKVWMRSFKTHLRWDCGARVQVSRAHRWGNGSA